jgi:ABC-type antimicrobial peptide transport system permease subunit
VLAGLLTQVFVLLVWLISKLPSMGRISVRMALRNMGTQKRRLGSTLLALCIGMLVLSTVTILSQNLKAAGQATLHRLNTNVFVQSTQDPSMVRRVDRETARIPGVSHRDIGADDSALTLSSVNGTNLNALLRRALKGDARGKHKFDKSSVSEAAGIATQGIQGHDPRTFGSTYLTISAGRSLATQDVGTNHLVVPAKLADPLGIIVGSHLVFSEGKRRIPFTVVGIISRKTFLVFNSTLVDLRYMQRLGLTTPDARHDQAVSLMISDKFLTPDIKTLQQRLPHAQVVDVSSFSSDINTYVDNLAVFPEILAVLCLVAGAVIIANTVALGMIERRHEFGVMKAVGAKRRGILQFLAVEHAIIGFVGAGVGVALAIAAATVLDRSLLYMSTSVNWLTIGGMVLLGIALALGASALTALPASSEKPLRALRYE